MAKDVGRDSLARVDRLPDGGRKSASCVMGTAFDDGTSQRVGALVDSRGFAGVDWAEQGAEGEEKKEGGERKEGSLHGGNHVCFFVLGWRRKQEVSFRSVPRR